MRFYSEKRMKNLRPAFEQKVLEWQRVSTKKMFGCPCYQVDGKLFSFLITNGIAITQLAQADLERLSRKRQTRPFRAGKKIVQKWVMIRVKNEGDLNGVMPFVRKSYESALHKS